MRQIFEELDFQRFEHPFKAKDAYRLRCGPYTFEAARLTNKWLQESYFLSGRVNTGRAISLLEVELPVEVDTREEGLALLGYFIGRQVPDSEKPPWLRIAERMSAYLPWSRVEKPPMLFSSATEAVTASGKKGSVPMLSQRFDEALVYASDIHRTQRRKGSETPYVAHLLGVAAFAIEAGGDEDQAIAALLHDAVEDQGGHERLADIERRFGPRVASIVSDCTDSDTTPKPPWRERKEHYIAAVPDKSPDSLLVSLCDKLYNAEAIFADLLTHGDELWTRFTGGKDGTLWYYQSLADAFEQALPGQLSAKLSRVVGEIQARARA